MGRPSIVRRAPIEALDIAPVVEDMGDHDLAVAHPVEDYVTADGMTLETSSKLVARAAHVGLKCQCADRAPDQGAIGIALGSTPLAPGVEQDVA